MELNKTHQTVLEVNLTALSNNVKFYKSRVKPTVKLMAMVKAFGYGAGVKEIGNLLQETSIDYLGVAFTDEAVELRNENITVPIVVMNMESTSFQDIVTHKLEPSIYSLEQLKSFINFLNNKNIIDYPIHLKIDTGMCRLGFLKYEIKELINLIVNQPAIHIKGIFSHLAAADDEKEDEFTLSQIKQFETNYHQIVDAIGYFPIKNILNTFGIERFTEFQFDMVRLGIGMYGSSKEEKIEVVNTLKTTISQIKEVEPGSSIGYGRKQYVEKTTLIGIIPIGYADGFNRSLSFGKGNVWINGTIVPVIGRISMDMTMIDLSCLDNVKVGDKVEIFGNNRPVIHFANELDTIPYEVFTSVAPRVIRTYIRN